MKQLIKERIQRGWYLRFSGALCMDCIKRFTPQVKGAEMLPIFNTFDCIVCGERYYAK